MNRKSRRLNDKLKAQGVDLGPQNSEADDKAALKSVIAKQTAAALNAWLEEILKAGAPADVIAQVMVVVATDLWRDVYGPSTLGQLKTTITKRGRMASERSETMPESQTVTS